jgi:putative redox protein
VATILRSKKHKSLTDYEVSVEAEQRQLPPQVFTNVRIHHSITGDDIDPQSVEEAIKLSETKYCSVGAMIRESGAEIRTTYSFDPTVTGKGASIQEGVGLSVKDTRLFG